jgi:DNA-binding MarR family transcriptional regulator
MEDFLGRGRFKMPPSVSRAELLDEDGVTDKRFRQFLYDFSALGTSSEAVRAYLAAQIGLTSPQYNVVMIVAQYQGADGVSGSKLAQLLHVTTAFISSEVGKLERMGWIEKRSNPKDGRSVLLQLTRLGEKKVMQIGPERRMVNDRLFKRLSAKDFRALSKTLAGLINDFSMTLRSLQAGQKQ